MKQRRFKGDRGVTLVIMALSALGIVGVAGLALDGGRVVGERRAMQNASDSAAMAGTRQLDLFLTGQISDASKIRAAVVDSATKNGADPSVVTCDLVTFGRTILGPCPTGTTMNPAFQTLVAGVKVGTSNTRDTFLMQAWGAETFTAVANATAQIGRPGGSYVAPFLVCATAPGHFPPLLIPDPTSTTGFAVNPLAIEPENEYIIYGNAIKLEGRDCGNPSGSFRGNVNTSSNNQLPGDWDTDTGNANGPTVRLVNSGEACSEDWVSGCMVVLPLCPSGNGQTGTNYRAYCVDLGLFEISFVELTGTPEIRAFFRGRATINQGGIVGPADENGARIVALTD